MDFIIDRSLVLYLPFYELDGASFMSRGACGHLCTVTGALWRPNGRFFDGSDDKIIIAKNSAFEMASAFTIEVWVNLDSSPPAQHQFAVEVNSNNYAERLGICAYRNVTGNKVGCYNTDTPGWVIADSALTLGTFCHSAATFTSGGALAFYLNGSADGTPALGNIPSWTAGDVKVDISLAGIGSALKGLIGEVRIYNRALTPLEIQHNYLATKWRYR